MLQPTYEPHDRIERARDGRGFDAAAAGLWCSEISPPSALPSVAVVGTRAATPVWTPPGAPVCSRAGAGRLLHHLGARAGNRCGGTRGSAERRGGRPSPFSAAATGISSRPVIANLAERIVTEGGAVLSPYPPEAKPRPWQFLARNGVVAALADAVLVVEAPARSGALNTASWAAGRIPVLAVPGDVDRKHVAGCLALIRDGATLARAPQDVLEALGRLSLAPPPAAIYPPRSHGGRAARGDRRGRVRIRRDRGCQRDCARSGPRGARPCSNSTDRSNRAELRGIRESRANIATPMSVRTTKPRRRSTMRCASFPKAPRLPLPRSIRLPPPIVTFEAPRRPAFGDFSTNLAFSLAKTARRSPQDVAAALVAELTRRAPELADRSATSSRRRIHQRAACAGGLARRDRARFFARANASARRPAMGCASRSSSAARTRPGLSSSCRDARCRSERRWQTRCAFAATTSSSNGSSTMRADSSMRSGDPSTRAIANFTIAAIRFPKTAIPANI